MAPERATATPNPIPNHRMRRRSLLTVGITVSLLAGCSPDDVVTPLTTPTLSADRADASDPTPTTISLQKIATPVGPGPVAAEITAFDDVSKRLFVANATFRTVDVFDLKDPAAPVKIATIDLSSLGSSVNSVAAHGGVVAMGVQGPLKTDPGSIAFYRATTLERVSSVGRRTAGHGHVHPGRQDAPRGQRGRA